MWNYYLNKKMEMKTVEREKVKIAYKVTGKGDTTLLFVHGSFIDMNYWSAQAEYFKSQYRVITVDLPGHGKSGKNRSTWTIQEYGKDVCSLIDELHLKNVILIGHSMGGDVILEVAARCPDSVKGFIGIENFKNAGTEMPQEVQKQFDYILQMLKLDFTNASEKFARQGLLSGSTNKAIVDRVVADYRNMDKDIGIELISDGFTYYERERELMSYLKYKMYLINVNYFPTIEDLLKKYAAYGYDVTLIKGTCHFPMIENPDEFNRVLLNVILKVKSC